MCNFSGWDKKFNFLEEMMARSIFTKSITAMSMVLLIYIVVFAQDPGTLKFNIDGTFKIVQFTDIHWKNESSQNSALLGLMSGILDRERPDMVVYTGDIITSEPAPKGWQTIVRPCIEKKIPWAVTLGNHDDEHNLDRIEIISLLEKLPYSTVQAGPAEIGGSGNSVMAIRDVKDQENAALVYFLDSNAYTPIEGVGSYGWIEFDQMEWYRQKSAHYTRLNNDEPLPALAFFHIPLPEYKTVWESPDSTCIGVKNEEVCAPAINTGMFAAMLESRDVMGVFVGHDHVNDYIGCLHGICLAYGRVTGLDAYGDLPRGARVIELSEGEREFKSWIRTENRERINEIHFPGSFRNMIPQTSEQ